MDGIVRLLEPVRIRWPLPIAGALAAFALALVPAQPAVSRAAHVELARHACADSPARTPVRSVQSIELERRWVLNEESPAAIDETLRTHVEAWEPFLYLLDAQPRMAVAGPAHAHREQWSFEFGRDQDGGIWLVRTAKTYTSSLDDAKYDNVEMFDREIFLLPMGSSFRGVIDR